MIANKLISLRENTGIIINWRLSLSNIPKNQRDLVYGLCFVVDFFILNKKVSLISTLPFNKVEFNFFCCMAFGAQIFRPKNGFIRFQRKF